MAKALGEAFSKNKIGYKYYLLVGQELLYEDDRQYP